MDSHTYTYVLQLDQLNPFLGVMYHKYIQLCGGPCGSLGVGLGGVVETLGI